MRCSSVNKVLGDKQNRNFLNGGLCNPNIDINESMQVRIWGSMQYGVGGMARATAAKLVALRLLVYKSDLY